MKMTILGAAVIVGIALVVCIVVLEWQKRNPEEGAGTNEPLF